MEYFILSLNTVVQNSLSHQAVTWITGGTFSTKKILFSVFIIAAAYLIKNKCAKKTLEKTKSILVGTAEYVSRWMPQNQWIQKIIHRMKTTKASPFVSQIRVQSQIWTEFLLKIIRHPRIILEKGRLVTEVMVSPILESGEISSTYENSNTNMVPEFFSKIEEYASKKEREHVIVSHHFRFSIREIFSLARDMFQMEMETPISEEEMEQRVQKTLFKWQEQCSGYDLDEQLEFDMRLVLVSGETTWTSFLKPIFLFRGTSPEEVVKKQKKMYAVEKFMCSQNFFITKNKNVLFQQSSYRSQKSVCNEKIDAYKSNRFHYGFRFIPYPEDLFLRIQKIVQGVSKMHRRWTVTESGTSPFGMVLSGIRGSGKSFCTEVMASMIANEIGSDIQVISPHDIFSNTHQAIADARFFDTNILVFEELDEFILNNCNTHVNSEDKVETLVPLSSSVETLLSRIPFARRFESPEEEEEYYKEQVALFKTNQWVPSPRESYIVSSLKQILGKNFICIANTNRDFRLLEQVSPLYASLLRADRLGNEYFVFNDFPIQSTIEYVKLFEEDYFNRKEEIDHQVQQFLESLTPHQKEKRVLVTDIKDLCRKGENIDERFALIREFLGQGDAD